MAEQLAGERERLLDEADKALRRGDGVAAERLVAPLRQRDGPPDPHVMNVLAIAAERRGDLAKAIEWTQRVLAHAPRTANNAAVLVRLLLLSRQYGDAERLAGAGLAEWPGDPQLSLFLQTALQSQNRHGDALAAIEAALAIHDDNNDLHARRAGLLATLGRAEEALVILAALPPDTPGRAMIEADALVRLGKSEQAAAQFSQLLEGNVEPSLETLLSVARGCTMSGAYEQALPILLRGMTRFPYNAEMEEVAFDAYQRLDNDSALQIMREASDTSVSKLLIQSCMVWTLRKQGRMTEAFDVANRAVIDHPDAPRLLSLRALIATSLGETHLSLQDLANLEKKGIEQTLPHASQIWFAHQFAPDVVWEDFAHMLERLDPFPHFDMSGCYPEAVRDPDPERKLRVGFLGSEFRRHAMAFTSLAFFDGLDSTEFELFVYDNSPHHDAFTSGFRQRTDHWREVAKLSDPALARAIHEDRIDILVDLPNHTENNRLPVFQYRAAPIQLSWMHPTLVGSIDHILSDEAFIPDGYAAALAPKKVWRIPSGALPYSPIGAADLTRVPTRAPGDREIIFGNCNAGHKLSRIAVRVYTRILNQMPHARLVMRNSLHTNEDGRAFQRQRFTEAGLSDPGQLDLKPFDKGETYLESYRAIDICLDSMPSGGGITSWDALLMGVPVVTLAGQGGTFTRNTASVLRAIGREEWISANEDAFVVTALELAGDPERLTLLRPILREEVLFAPVNRGGFQREVGAIFRAMWRERVTALLPENAGEPSWLSVLRQASAELAGNQKATASLEIFQRALSAVGRPEEAIAFAERRFALGGEVDLDVIWRCFIDMGLQSGPDWNEICRGRRRTMARISARAGGIPSRRYERGEDPNRRLRIGYFASDLHLHALGLSAMSLLRGASHDAFEIHIYCAEESHNDQINAFFRNEADHWRDIVKLDDDGAAELIHEDRIDLLVDLENHRRFSRHGVLLRRPAPIQIAWMHPLAIAEVDHVTTDTELTPPGYEEGLAPCHVWRLEAGALPYSAILSVPLHPNPPILDNGYPTIGLIGMPYKLNKRFLRLVALVMQESGAHLVMRNSIADEPAGDALLLGPFHAAGIDPARVTMLPRAGADRYFDTFNRIDVFLDAMPRAGGVTVWDSLYMGVPVVTLRGQGGSFSRNGASVLRAAGLDGWIAGTEEEYVGLAVKLLGDRGELVRARRTLRRRVQMAAINTGGRYVREMEAIYRRIWRNYCEQGR